VNIVISIRISISKSKYKITEYSKIMINLK
jgi:hypothetical protein